MTRLLLSVATLLALAVSGRTAQIWELTYFYDQDQSSLTIQDLAFASPRRGVAVGILNENGRERAASLVTSDGGATWELVRLKEPGTALFFLNETLGWMVTPKGIWQTQEAGRSWRKLGGPRNLLRVYFTTPERGWAVGLRKSAYETSDGGKTWTKVAAAETPKAKPEYTAYGWIEFANPEVGMITGWNRPPRRTDRGLPDWIDPEQARFRREWPGLSIFLETRDGGKNWAPSTVSTFGRVTRVRFSPEGFGLGLIEFFGAMDEWTSEVYRMEWKTSGQSRRVYRDKSLVVTDIALQPGGEGLLAGVQALGQLKRSPIPGKVRILRGSGLETWTEMEVDYRATARRVILATSGDHAWAATDTGMILKLRKDP
ncbi:MAG: hypothetical protein IT158_08855 [Bryobacterales bacterium]|nr:hypothetical protein [Bryobacterales bacterium]